MAISLTPKPLEDSASQIGLAFEEARKHANLGRAAAASKIGVDPQTLYRWEKQGVVERAEVASVLRAEAVYGVPLIPMIRERLGIDVSHVAENSPPFDVGDAPEARFPFAQVMRTPAVRARLAAFRTEVVGMGASEDGEERLVAKLRDRQTINDFVGGRDEDRYSEREIIRVIDNYARILKDISKELGMP